MSPTNIRPAKGYYSEVEAAASLGVSIDKLRSLIRSHIVHGDDEMLYVASATYQPSDLLILRMMLNARQHSPQAEPVSAVESEAVAETVGTV